MKFQYLTFSFIIIFSIKAFSQSPSKVLPLIPYPAELTERNGAFELTQNTRFVFSDTLLNNEAEYFLSYLKTNYDLNLQVLSLAPSNGYYIELRKVNPDPVPTVYNDSEYYQLNIEKDKIIIEANSGVGIFNAFQTFIQLLPVQKSKKLPISCVLIKDYPRYKYRGMHLDCSRHFFPASFIKKYIDCIASYKMNVFHWHLTDDQGWRIEIKQYPRLTEVGAWRKGSMVGLYSDNKIDSVPYGGFYTQEEIIEIVHYAQKRHINIIPEIEMPGHSLAVIAAYPGYSCTGLPVEVGVKWGVEKNVFCPTEETFVFLDNILSEIVNLFPSKYIHIGGDEVLKEEWNQSTFCKELMKRENLKDAHELQAYFIRRVEKIVNSKGRIIIGWDEILEGGLAPNAVVMSWRGMDGGIAAARQNHFVVMSPGSHCYFDHYQGIPETEPLAIGGFTPLDKTYSYEPTPAGLNETEASYIMGAQGNVWTEYINSTEQVEYMAMPRMSALAEVLWSKKENRNYAYYIQRLLPHLKLLDQRNIHYAKSIYNLKVRISPVSNLGEISYELSTIFDPKGIRYTTDGSEPTNGSQKYLQPIIVSKSQLIKAAYFENKKKINTTISQNFLFSKATGRSIQLKNEPSEQYRGNGAFTLINGVRGNLNRTSNDWLGFEGDNMEAIIDFGYPASFSHLELNYLVKPEYWIHPPKKITIFSSKNGIEFNEIKTVQTDEINSSKNTRLIKFENQSAQFIKVVAENTGIIPCGYPGENEKAWLFMDEIIIQ